VLVHRPVAAGPRDGRGLAVHRELRDAVLEVRREDARRILRPPGVVLAVRLFLDVALVGLLVALVDAGGDARHEDGCAEDLGGGAEHAPRGKHAARQPPRALRVRDRTWVVGPLTAPATTVARTGVPRDSPFCHFAF